MGVAAPMLGDLALVKELTMIVNTLRRHNKMFDRVAAATRYSHGSVALKRVSLLPLDSGRQRDATALGLHRTPWTSQYAYVFKSFTGVRVVTRYATTPDVHLGTLVEARELILRRWW